MPVNRHRKALVIIACVCLSALISLGCNRKKKKIYYHVSVPTGTSTSPLPGMVSNPVPSDMAQNVPLEIRLDWPDTANTDTYALLLTADDKAPVSVQNLTESHFYASGLAGNITYYWKVWSTNSVGTTDGPVWSFFTNPNMPYQVSLGLPNDGAEDVPLSVLLDWNTANKATGYNVYFGPDTDPPLVAIGITTSQWQASSLDNETIYYWRIDSSNSYGVTTGIVWNFTTEGTAP